MVCISVFGPRKIIQELTCSDLGAEQFLKSFNEIIVPWCLKRSSHSIAAKLDLLLALLDDECFSEQWDAVVSYLVDREKVGSDPEAMDRNCISILAILMEKVRERTCKSVQQSAVSLDIWHHELLDFVAVYVAQAYPAFGNSDAYFLW